MVGIYDKGLIDSTFIQDVSECLEQKTTVCTELNELRNCEIAIAHVSDEEWDSLIEDYSSPDSIRVRVTIGGDFFNNNYYKPPSKENGIYTFYLIMQAGDLKAEEWEDILLGLSDPEIVEKLVEDKNPNGLRRFFVYEVQRHLPALTILCEGYLAVHAEIEDSDINSALELMKWTEFRESERGQKVIRSDLNKKMDAVQQSEWWLEVFERESFYENVNKEWKKATGAEEIPMELNDLLEAIRSDESVVPPKIVADAYCVLEKKIIAALSEWQIRRNKFNHTWLQNKFLRSFEDFVEQLQKRKPDLSRVSEFLKEDFPAWKSQQQEVQWIVQSFEDSMSPRQLLDCSPLNRCDDDTREWLGRLVHGLWLSRYSVKKKTQESQNALVTVNKFYEKIMDELRQSKPIKLTTLISLRPQFCELKQTYEVLSKTLSNLPQEG